MDWFYDTPVIGARPPHEIEAYLRELLTDIVDTEDRLGIRDSVQTFFSNELPLWAHTTHIFGFLPVAEKENTLHLQDAGSIKPDTSLKGQQVRITLDHLRIASYPGGGMHHILFDFYTRNQTDNEEQDLHFNANYRIRDGEQAAIRGYPIFIGLTVGQDGLLLRCFTVNVKNEQDEVFLEFLESDSFRNGLQLLATSQPALVPLSQMAFYLTRRLAKRHRNIPVQDFALGMDFSHISGGIRLAEGSYVVLQIPPAALQTWKWEDWVYNRKNGQITRRDKSGAIIPYNYIVFSIVRME